MLNSIKSVKNLVEHCLLTKPETRMSDKELTFAVWDMCDIRLTKEQKDKIRKLPFSLESVRRIRQKFQELKMYLPPKGKQQGRLLAAKKMKEVYKVF